MPIDVTEMLKSFIQDILSHPKSAQQFAEDPYGKLTESGLTDADLSGVDVRQVVGDVCGSGTIPASTSSALQSYASGSSGPPSYSGHQSVEQVVQQLSYVTNVAYSDDHSVTTITDNSTDIDESVHVGGNVDGDIDVDNVNATGDGSVAAGQNSTVNAATGDGSQAIGGDNFGQANSGAGAVQIGNAPGGLGGYGDPILTREVPGFGGGIGPINTGTNTGVLAGGNVDDTVVGDHNTVANVDGPLSNSTLNFGDGDVANVGGSTVANSAIGAGGDTSNISGNAVGPGGAISGDGPALGNYSDSHDVSTETSTIDADNSVVGSEQGPGDQHLDGEVHQDLDLGRPPVLEPLRAADGPDDGGDPL